jgi:putative spermidine/putrescine transport system permease protein
VNGRQTTGRGADSQLGAPPPVRTPAAARPLRLGALPAAGVIGLLFGGALVGAVRTSLQPDPLAGAYSLDAWRAVLGDARFGAAVAFTTAVAAITTALSVLIAVPVAAALRGRGWSRTIATLPVLVPHLLIAAVAVLWLGPGGLVDRVVAGLPFDVVRARSGLGIVIVYLVKEVPFLALLVLSVWDDDVAAREEAAAVHGACPVATIWHVVLPAVRGPLVMGALVIAAFVLGSFEVPLVMGPTTPDTIATYALAVTQVADLSGRAESAAALLVATAGAFLLAAAAGVVVWRRHG